MEFNIGYSFSFFFFFFSPQRCRSALDLDIRFLQLYGSWLAHYRGRRTEVHETSILCVYIFLLAIGRWRWDWGGRMQSREEEPVCALLR